MGEAREKTKQTNYRVFKLSHFVLNVEHIQSAYSLLSMQEDEDERFSSYPIRRWRSDVKLAILIKP